MVPATDNTDQAQRECWLQSFGWQFANEPGELRRGHTETRSINPLYRVFATNIEQTGRTEAFAAARWTRVAHGSRIDHDRRDLRGEHRVGRVVVLVTVNVATRLRSRLFLACDPGIEMPG